MPISFGVSSRFAARVSWITFHFAAGIAKTFACASMPLSSRGYIAHGIRERASGMVTLELGRQTEQEISRQLEREVDAERFPRLDRMLIAEQAASNEFADLRPDKDMVETMRQNRLLLIDRARKLERMGLATNTRRASGRYRRAPSRCFASWGRAATSSKQCTRRWTARGWRNSAPTRVTPDALRIPGPGLSVRSVERSTGEAPRPAYHRYRHVQRRRGPVARAQPGAGAVISDGLISDGNLVAL